MGRQGLTRSIRLSCSGLQSTGADVRASWPPGPRILAGFTATRPQVRASWSGLLRRGPRPPGPRILAPWSAHPGHLARGPWPPGPRPASPGFSPGSPGYRVTFYGPQTRIDRAQRAAPVTPPGARARFLSNIHQEKRMNVNCLIFVQKIAYNQSREPCAAIRYSSIKTKGPL